MGYKIYRLGYDKEFKFGWPAEFFKKRRFSLASGKSASMTPYMALPETEYISRGLTTIMTIGRGNDQLDNANTSIFTDAGYLQAIAPDKDLNLFTRDQCRSAVFQHWLDSGNPFIITSGAQEARHINGGDRWAQIFAKAPDQYRWIEEAWADLAAANPGKLRNFGCYDGSFVPWLEENQAAIRAAFQSPEAALAYLKANEYGENPYWTQELWRYRDVLLNQYYRGYYDTHHRYAQLLVAIELSRLALSKVAPHRKVIVFVFGVKSEFTGYSAGWRRGLKNGSVWNAFDFPSYSPAFQDLAAFQGVSRADDFFAWEDTRYNGYNEEVPGFDVVLGDGTKPFYLSGPDLPRGSHGPKPYDKNGNYCYPPRPSGYEDLMPSALEHEQIFRSKVKNMQWLRHRPSGSNNWCSLEKSYVMDRYMAKEAYVEGGVEGNWAVVQAVDMVMDFSGARMIQTQLPNGATVDLKIYAEDPNRFLIDLNAQ